MDMSERNKEIFNVWVNGERTYKEIGEKYNLTGQRVKEIIQKEVRKRKHMAYIQENGPSDDLTLTDIDHFTLNRLVNRGITTLSQLADQTEEELLGIRVFGVKCLAEVKRVLSAHGLSLKEVQNGL